MSKMFMLPALIYWAIVSSIAICFSLYAAYQELKDVYNGDKPHIYRESADVIYGFSSTGLTVIQHENAQNSFNMQFHLF